MTEFYYDLSNDDVKALIQNKMEMYDFECMECNCEVKSSYFIYEALKRKLEKEGKQTTFRLFSFIGMHLGIHMYHFYNVVSVSSLEPLQDAEIEQKECVEVKCEVGNRMYTDRQLSRLSRRTIGELRQFCYDHNIKYSSKHRKAELIEFLSKVTRKN